MNRRDFLSSGSAVAALTAVPSAAAPPPQPALMRLGCQSAPTNEQHLQYTASVIDPATHQPISN